MIKDITFGQYYQTDSPIHRLDPRIKLVLLVLMIVFLFLAGNAWSLIFCGVMLFAAMLVSRVPFKMYLKNMKPILIIVIFTSIINLFYTDTGVTLVDWWIIHITAGGVYRALFMAFRIAQLILLSSVLTYTTTPNDLTDGIERLLSPLRFIGLRGAVHTLAMMMTIALRFIPTLVDETDKIMNAQKARGADLESGKLFERIRALIPILIPLLISSIRRAYELAEAMECRCYNGGVGRKRMKQMKLKLRDYIAAFLCLAVSAGVLLINLLPNIPYVD
ncbi:MAG: energy-coupling factor transporter transmembrane protein EcfT [Ruminococcaceae bacterium]|nr:energy-coupling factor transporter transmembrane protein EcfT [Oscillospiraceae bacterium]